MLAYRIWSVDRDMKKLNIETESEPGRRSSLSPILRIILESGLINAAYLFAYVMTLEFGSQGLEIMSEMVSGLESRLKPSCCLTGHVYDRCRQPR